MNSIVYSELSQDIKKLYALEESIIGDHSESRELRSRQALLLSEVIQSLHKVQAMVKAEAQVAMVEHQTFA